MRGFLAAAEARALAAREESLRERAQLKRKGRESTASRDRQVLQFLRDNPGASSADAATRFGLSKRSINKIKRGRK